jgi:outer membrane protein assembly complex protein YaeT
MMRSIAILGALLFAIPALHGQATSLMVREVSFEGNKALDDATLAAGIATTNSSWLARLPLIGESGLGAGEVRFFNERAFWTDIERVKLLYKWSGYLEVQVDTLVQRSDEDIKVKFLIQEGPPTILTRFIFEGLEDVSDITTLTRDLPLVIGDVFNRDLLDATVDTLTMRLRNAGYPEAEVDRQGRVDSLTRTADATILARPGRAAVFGTIRVTGNDLVDSGFVASMVTAREGERYELDERFRSQRALYGTDLFRQAIVAIDTTRFTTGDSVVPLWVDVREGPSHRVRASVGYGTNDCFRTSAGWTARNFLGNGRVVEVSGRLSKIGVGSPFGMGLERNVCGQLQEDTVGSRLANYGVDVTLRRHGFLSPDNTLVLTLFSERRSEYKVYMREDIGAGVTVTRQTAADIPITLGYRISYGLTRANAASFCSFFNACLATDVVQLGERRVLTTLTLSALRQRVNNVLDPTRGSTVSAEATVSSRFLGSSRLQQFTRLLADAAGYVPLSRTFVLAGHLRGGLIFAPNLDLESGAANFVPPDQRFYAGGPNDVRGYDRNELGPVVYVVARENLDTLLNFDEADARVSATGGSKVAIANLELRIPSPFMGDRLRFGLFVDAGGLWDDQGRGGIRVTPGAGLRFISPLGPIRFDVGYNPYRLQSGAVYTTSEAGDLVKIRDNFSPQRSNKWTIHFSVGHAF